ncbi:cysteine--1-D-myo-inosityl 2-amino-2-deoxy-alpha-D-glucopyranoside ligase [Citricoccus muralis]|uniref:L-cysteine:1D-myo-inositol 2-amino-2-deoxy-alpha-D-glucopyranoside ligase n=1 Tax=Citricoccus muralis TaxID=169134 RepID=A0ABY8H3C3_9MICC|nr:cysteine--1-D-myo-inosityl 2-amino-2-deoxy-alpha-D-glucopyranoside ligase [Citricoccus muralis]WFP15344.1 cysteine--1-D-myo-inosityl 2-amino-2-deoxy-alpha-D-glucopyranoside ligase [Citricoccus muralis]
MRSWPTTDIPQLPVLPNALRIWDTASGALQPAGTQQEASLYVCGITPYDATHLGHANTYVSFDLLLRYWRASGLKVSYVQNVTDVDDPLLERAEATGVDWRELAESQTDLFRADMEALNVIAPDHYLGATETVDWVVDAVSTLIDKGVAYRVPADPKDDLSVDGDVYFSVDTAEAQTSWTLGSVGGLSLEDMTEVFPERGGDPQRPGKRNPFDPLLWRAAREGEPVWDGGQLGPGRPGWHIECSCIARRLLPAPFSVQGGGADLRFPHHEFSAAHATAVDGKPLAEAFLHAGMVGLDGVKMSKSLGNLVLVSQLRRRGVEPVAIRALLLSHHYRTDWSFTEEELGQAQARVEGWRSALGQPAAAQGSALYAQLHDALSDDLNAPAALLHVDAWAERVHNGETEGDAAASDQTVEPTVAEVLNGLLGLVL